MRKLLMTVLMFFLLWGTANATIIFQDNFDSENNGNYALNYNGFTKWDVVDGTVDLIGDGSPWDWFDPSYGLYVDLDGSNYNAGKMLSTDTIHLTAGTYLLSFELAGNQRNTASETTEVNVETGIFSGTYSLSQNAPFQLFQEVFTVTSDTDITLAFEGVGGDRIGMLLDNVKLETAPVPEPATMMLFGIGLLGLAGVSRRKK